MKFNTENEFWNQFYRDEKTTANSNGETLTDNSGQLVVYTGFFRWKDQTIRDTPDPSWGVHELTRHEDE